MRATLVVPTLNEAASIGHVLDTFRTASESANLTLFAEDPIEWEILVIDGASTDGTAEIAPRRGARVVVEPRKGYGRAYRTGFDGASGEFLATLDGDATYPAEEIPRLLRYLIDEGLDFLTTDRLAYLDTKAMTREHRIGNWVLNQFLGLAYHRYFRATRPGAPRQPERYVGLPMRDPPEALPDPERHGDQRGTEDRGGPERPTVRRDADPLLGAMGGPEALELAGRWAEPRVPPQQAARAPSRVPGRPGGSLVAGTSEVAPR